MPVERKVIHEVKNQLSISIGLVELSLKAATKDGANVDIAKIIDRLERAMIAQRKLQEIFETNFSKEAMERIT